MLRRRGSARAARARHSGMDTDGTRMPAQHPAPLPEVYTVCDKYKMFSVNRRQHGGLLRTD